MFLLPEWWKQLPKAALQKQKNNENCHPGKTWYSYFHPEQGGHCGSLQWPYTQIVQEDRYLKREKQSLLQFSCSVLSDSLWPHEPHHTRPPCKLLTPGANPNSCPLSQWCHPTISFSVIPFSSCLQSFPASGSFQMSKLFTSGCQSIGVSASTSVLPMNTQDWSPLGWTGWISLQSKGLSRVFSNATVQKHQFFGTQLSL